MLQRPRRPKSSAWKRYKNRLTLAFEETFKNFLIIETATLRVQRPRGYPVDLRFPRESAACSISRVTHCHVPRALHRGFKPFGRYSAAHVVTPSARTNQRLLSTHGHTSAPSIRSGYFIPIAGRSELPSRDYSFFSFFILAPYFTRACTEPRETRRIN